MLDIHNLDTINGVKVIRKSRNSAWKDIFISVIQINEEHVVMPAIKSVMVSMILNGAIEGHVQIGNTINYSILHTGVIIFLPEDHEISIQNNRSAELLSIYISEESWRAVGSAVKLFLGSEYSAIYNHFIADGFIQNILLHLKEIFDQNDKLSAIEIDFIAKSISSRIILEHSNIKLIENCKDHVLFPTLQKVLSYIDDHLTEKLELEYLAAIAGFSSAHFARLFKQATSQTLHQFIICRRIDKAKLLLEHSSTPIIDIAHECGFSDQVHLTRFFTRIVGSSPAVYRRFKRK